MKNHSPLQTSLLPQYQASAAFMERFLVAAHDEGLSIERSPNNYGVKFVDDDELKNDVLDYFIDNKEIFRKEFVQDLSEKIDIEELNLFCSVVANEWFDGKRLRENGLPRRLKRSVYEYLSVVSNGFDIKNFVQIEKFPIDVEPLISVETVAAILTVNDQIMHYNIEEWKKRHSNYDELSDTDIFLKRGLALSKPIDTSLPYREWDFINSYSLAFSLSEKFSQMTHGRLPAIVNGELALYNGRILFFSPFIPEMEVGQLEFGIIPSDQVFPIHYQGKHADIMEYIIDPLPFQKDEDMLYPIDY
jgi:hypothetical protein